MFGKLLVSVLFTHWLFVVQASADKKHGGSVEYRAYKSRTRYNLNASKYLYFYMFWSELELQCYFWKLQECKNIC